MHSETYTCEQYYYKRASVSEMFGSISQVAVVQTVAVKKNMYVTKCLWFNHSVWFCYGCNATGHVPEVLLRWTIVMHWLHVRNNLVEYNHRARKQIHGSWTCMWSVRQTQHMLQTCGIGGVWGTNIKSIFVFRNTASRIGNHQCKRTPIYVHTDRLQMSCRPAYVHWFSSWQFYALTGPLKQFEAGWTFGSKIKQTHVGDASFDCDVAANLSWRFWSALWLLCKVCSGISMQKELDTLMGYCTSSVLSCLSALDNPKPSFENGLARNLSLVQRFTISSGLCYC